MLRIVFDVTRLEAKRKELEQIAALPEFWGNQAEAKKHMLNLDDVRDQLQLLEKWKMFISDAEASLDLYNLDPEEDMIAESYQGLATLKENLDKLNVMADALLKYETIDAPQIDDIMAGANPREPEGWSDNPPSDKSNKKSSIKGTAEEL